MLPTARSDSLRRRFGRAHHALSPRVTLGDPSCVPWPTLWLGSALGTVGNEIALFFCFPRPLVAGPTPFAPSVTRVGFGQSLGRSHLERTLALPHVTLGSWAFSQRAHFPSKGPSAQFLTFSAQRHFENGLIDLWPLTAPTQFIGPDSLSPYWPPKTVWSDGLSCARGDSVLKCKQYLPRPKKINTVPVRDLVLELPPHGDDRCNVVRVQPGVGVHLKRPHQRSLLCLPEAGVFAEPLPDSSRKWPPGPA